MRIVFLFTDIFHKELSQFCNEPLQRAFIARGLHLSLAQHHCRNSPPILIPLQVFHQIIFDGEKKFFFHYEHI